MNRAARLAALALILAPGATYGQPGPVGFRMVGAFQTDDREENGRSVRLEMEGGQKLEGTIRFRPLIVDSDLGRYTIRPDKIKMIQFLRRANVDDPRPAAAAPMAPQVRGNFVVVGGMVQARETLVRGKVVTTSDKVIIGDIHIPADFALELEFGTLSPEPDKLRTLTMTQARPGDGEPGNKPAQSAPPSAPNPGPPARSNPSGGPR